MINLIFLIEELSNLLVWIVGVFIFLVFKIALNCCSIILDAVRKASSFYLPSIVIVKDL